MSESKVQQYKVDAVAKLSASLDEAKAFIFADYRGLTVEQISSLRLRLGEEKAKLRVVKNAYARIAFKAKGHEEVFPFLVGPTALTYVEEEAGTTAKALFDFAKHAPLKVKGGLVESQIYDAAGIEALSKLPSKLELVQVLMSAMKAPMNNLVYAINGVTQKLVRTLDAVREKKVQEG